VQQNCPNYLHRSLFWIYVQCLDTVGWASEQDPACKTTEQVLACLSVDLTQSRVTADI